MSPNPAATRRLDRPDPRQGPLTTGQVDDRARCPVALAGLDALRWLRHAALLLLAVTTLAAAAIELPKSLAPLVPQPAASAAEPASAALSADDWRARQAQAQAAHERLQALPDGSAPLLTERQLASMRLQALLAAQVEATSTAQGEPRRVPSAVPSVQLDGPGPYSAVEVDALRDQLDDLKAQRDALRLSLEPLESEVRSAIELRNSANANFHLRRDQTGRAIGADTPALQQAQVELASLNAQSAALAVLHADRQRQQTQARLAALQEPLAQLEAEFARVRARQQLDAATLALKLQELDGEERSLASERARLEERMTQRSRLPADPGSTRGHELAALQGAAAALRELQALVRRQATAWNGRHDLLAGDLSPDERRVQATALASALQQLASQQRSVADRQGLLRIEMRTRSADAAGSDEQRLQEVQQLHLTALQRLEESLRRSTVMLERMREDAAAGDLVASAQGWLDRTQWALGERLQALWQTELFSATETTVVDGQVVTIEHGVTVGKSVGLLVLLVLGYLAAGALARRAAQMMIRRVGISPQFAQVLQRWIGSILILAVLLLVLRLARIPLTAFAFLGGALAIGIGFGTQNIIKNLISGVIILLERKIRVGDTVTIGGVSGTVVTVDFRATTVRGFDGIDSIVPNSQLLENQISNWSGGGPSVRRVLTVGVAYGCDVRRAAERVTDCARADASVLADPAPEVLLQDFGSDALTLRLLYWIRMGSVRSGPQVDSDLRFAIEQALREAGIGIAFPQRDVHLDLTGPVRVEMVGPRRDTDAQ